MKINHQIYQKRKKLGLTQEQVAACLGVSASAVHKWEKGTTYPDITLLPALASLLKTDLNTLLSFRDDLTDTEIEAFVNALDDLAQEQGYPAAFACATTKLRAYPSCDRLLYTTVLYLYGALSLFAVSDADSYKAALEPYYQRLSNSDIPEIRETAISMLIAYSRNRGDFAEAEALIQTLPQPTVDREEQIAVLYQQEKRHADAEKIWEHRILKSVTNIQTALSNLLEIAWADGRSADAAAFSEQYETVTQAFCMPDWMQYLAHLQVALLKQDAAGCLSLLQRMLPAMKKEWEPQRCLLYRHAADKETSILSSRMADVLYRELMHSPEYAFLRAHPDFDCLMEQLA